MMILNPEMVKWTPVEVLQALEIRIIVQSQMVSISNGIFGACKPALSGCPAHSGSRYMFTAGFWNQLGISIQLFLH